MLAQPTTDQGDQLATALVTTAYVTEQYARANRYHAEHTLEVLRGLTVALAAPRS